ncbi:MAG: threonine synthase, partial [Gaiellaceae bacterium]|nr:threonine synthase [Gaiellaceae bacterium]
IGLLARTTGIFTETAGGVTIATLAQLVRDGRLDPDASTVAYITGDGLKTPDAALSHVAPISIAADIDAVDAVLEPLAVR